MKKVDFHSHVIPNIDDGAKDFDTALKMLEDSFCQGVDLMVATPHFKGTEKDIDKFISNRNDNFDLLMQKVGESSIQIPKVCLGAEVLICPGISDFKDLGSLCIEGTDYILLEMPNSYWYDAIFDEIYKIILKKGLTPIIAHVERYSPRKTGVEQYYKLFTMDIVLQINTSAFCSFFSRKKAQNIIKYNSEHSIVLGSDCHDLIYRKTCFKKACYQISRNMGNDFIDKIFLTSENILNNQSIENI